MKKSLNLSKAITMTSITLRRKLKDYIEVADEKKIKAIYTMVEEDINANYEWWKDKELIAELDKRSSDIKTGKVKTIFWDDAKKKILGGKNGHKAK